MMESTKDLVPRFFDKTALTYDKIVNRYTFGKDKYWKDEILKKIPDGNSILDLACGTGILTEKISKKFPNAKIVGVDMTEGYLELAKKRLSKNENISFVMQDAEKLDLNEKFDCITSSYIPKYCNPEILIKTCLKHLKPGGTILLHDFIYPKNKTVKFLWNKYFSLLNYTSFLVPSWKQVFVELPKLIRKTNWLNDCQKIMQTHGLKVEIHTHTWGSTAILYGIDVI